MRPAHGSGQPVSRNAAQLPAVARLWPDAILTGSRRPGRDPALLVLPSRRTPRVLVPADVPRAAAMLNRHSSSSWQRLVQDVLALVIRSGALPLLPVWRLRRVGPQSTGIEGHVTQTVPGAARVGVLLGPPRANAKSVLQIFDARGRTIAFGKISHNRLSSQLVRHEAAVLARLAGLDMPHVRVPRVIFSGKWNGNEVLYMEAFARIRVRAPSWAPPLVGCAEVAESGGVAQHLLGQSPYLERLRVELAASALQDVHHLSATLDAVLQRYGDVPLLFGRWHGDWAPWNMTLTGDLLHVWDWERSRDGVPVGFDMAHFLMQRRLRRGAEAVNAGSSALVPALSESLRRWYDTEPAVKATLLLYLVEIARRYLDDAEGSPTPQLTSRLRRLRQDTVDLLSHGSRVL